MLSAHQRGGSLHDGFLRSRYSSKAILCNLNQELTPLIDSQRVSASFGALDRNSPNEILQSAVAGDHSSEFRVEVVITEPSINLLHDDVELMSTAPNANKSGLGSLLELSGNSGNTGCHFPFPSVEIPIMMSLHWLKSQ